MYFLIASMVNGHSLSSLSCVAILRMTTLLRISSHRAIRDNRHACSIALTNNCSVIRAVLDAAYKLLKQAQNRIVD